MITIRVTWEGQIKATILSQYFPVHSLPFNDCVYQIIRIKPGYFRNYRIAFKTLHVHSKHKTFCFSIDMKVIIELINLLKYCFIYIPNANLIVISQN